MHSPYAYARKKFFEFICNKNCERFQPKKKHRSKKRNLPVGHPHPRLPNTSPPSSVGVANLLLDHEMHAICMDIGTAVGLGGSFLFI